MNSRGVAAKFPVLLGGAALTRAYVEHDLSEIFTGDVRYARDAFEGLRLMDALMAVRRGGVAVDPDGPDDTKLSDDESRKLAERKARRERSLRIAAERRAAEEAESTTRWRAPGPTWPPTCRCRPRRSSAPGWSRASRWPSTPACWTSGPPSWASGASRAAAAGKGPSYEELVETEGRPRLRYWLDRFQTEGMLEAAVVYGYFHCVSEGNKLIILGEDGGERGVRSSSRASAGTGGCAWPTSSGPGSPARPTWWPSTWSPWAQRISEFANELFAANNYRDYLEVHGLSVQLTEALAELWHRRVRDGARGRRRGLRPTWTRSSSRATGVRGTPSATRPARTWRTRSSCSGCCEPERIGVELSEEFQLVPEQSTSAIIVPHPEAKYFAAK